MSSFHVTTFRKRFCLPAKVCMAVMLGATSLLLAADTPPEVQKILDHLKAGDVKVQGQVQIKVKGKTIVLKPEQAPEVLNVRTPTKGPPLQGPALSTLRWRNGETLDGDLVGVTQDTLLWSSPQFTEPLALDLAVLDGIDYPSSVSKSAEPFLVRMRDGSRLFCTLKGGDEKSLKLHSARHGELSLLLSEIVSLQRTRGPGLLYQGPNTPESWRPMEALRSGNPRRVPASPEWGTREDGTFGTTHWNRGTQMDLSLPEKVEAVIRVRAGESTPEFTFTMDAGDGSKISVENWSGSLVLVQGTRFIPLMELKETATVSVRLLWDRVKAHAWAFTPEGHLLGELKPALASMEAFRPADPTPGAGAPSLRGVQLRNNGSDLTLEELRVREWSGTLPSMVKAGEPHVELADGSIQAGRVVQVNEKNLTLSTGKTLSLDQLESLQTGKIAAGEKSTPETLLAFEDGTRIGGKLEGAGAGLLTMRLVASPMPVISPAQGLQRVLLRGMKPGDAASDASLAMMDSLSVGRITLHGKVQGAGSPVPHWLPVGGRASVALSPGLQPVFTRPMLDPERVKPAPALVYLEGGEVCSAEIQGLDADTVSIHSPYMGAKELPAPLVQAVQFRGRSLEWKGFSDPGWRRIRGSATAVSVDSSKVIFREAGTLMHSSILQGDEVKFSLFPDEGWGAMRVRLLTAGTEEPVGGISFLIYLSGTEVYTGLESEQGGEFANQIQIKSAQGQPVTFRATLGERQVEIFVNGVSVTKVSALEAQRTDAAAKVKVEVGNPFRGRNKVAAPKVLGQGIVIETANIWGNGEQPVSIKDFSVRPNPMRPAMPPIDIKAREQVLTIPRFRSDNPPTHALLAINGDMLRGQLEAATSEHLRILSGLESLTIPRDRLAGFIRLIPPDVEGKKTSGGLPSSASSAETHASPPITPTHWLLLTDGGRVALQVERFAEDMVVGTSALLGRCQIPWESIHTLQSTAPDPGAMQLAYQDWKLAPAPEPVLPTEGGQSSPLTGKVAKDFRLPLLAGGEFDFSKQPGKVILLDFWATWCGPCIQSLPELMEAVKTLSEDEAVKQKFVFVAVNEGEGAPQVKRFLEQRNWNLPVALDMTQAVGRQFQVEGIPHTLLISPDGKIIWQNVGHRPGAAKEIVELVKKLAAESPMTAP